MPKVAVSLILLVLSGLANAAPVYILNVAEWAGPKDGSRILQMDGVGAAVREMDAQQDSRLLLRYPGGDEGSLWVQELRSWLLEVQLQFGSMRCLWNPVASRPDPAVRHRISLKWKS